MKKLQLTLTDPCLQQWDDLKPVGAGLRYCDSCEKHIVDLTTKSDAELIQFFKKKKDNVCGRLLSSQLDRELILPRQKTNWQWLLPLAMGAIAVTPVQANELKPVIVENNPLATFPLQSLKEVVKTPISADIISGHVVDHKTGKPLTGVKVKQKGFENVLAITDSTGKFDLDIHNEDKLTVFIFELNGYGIVETKLDQGMVIKLDLELRVVVGAISTVSLHQEPLYLLNAGKNSCTINAAQLKEISPYWIESLQILKDVKATAIYGSKAANGVILIQIKKQYEKKINFSGKNK